MLQYVSYQVHITFFYPTVISGGGGVAGGVTGKKAVKPVATVQDCVLQVL